jgi:hypothetical protein
LKKTFGPNCGSSSNNEILYFSNWWEVNVNIFKNGWQFQREPS